MYKTANKIAFSVAGTMLCISIAMFGATNFADEDVPAKVAAKSWVKAELSTAHLSADEAKKRFSDLKL